MPPLCSRQRAMPVMAPSLTATGIFWVCLSLAAAVLNSAGFYLPYWIKGTLFNNTEVSFGSFRRCNYPRVNEEGKFELVLECGRYTGFTDIPSWAWQVSTVLVGVGASLSLLVAFTAMAALCVSDVVTKFTARILGGIQMVSAVLVASGVSIYPQGWGSREVAEACGGISKPYNLATQSFEYSMRAFTNTMASTKAHLLNTYRNCELSWSMYILVSSASLLILCSGLSFKASRIEPHSYRI